MIGGKVFIDEEGNQLPYETGYEPEEQKEKTEGVVRKPQTAYFFFMSEQRRENKKVSNKDLTNIWNSMAPDEKRIYTSKAEAMKKEYLDYLSTLPPAEDPAPNAFDDDIDQPEEADDIGQTLPLFRVKAIVKQDEELADCVKPDAYRYLQQATYKYLSDLVASSIQKMRASKKKKLMPAFMQQVCNENHQYLFLLDANIFKQPAIANLTLPTAAVYSDPHKMDLETLRPEPAPATKQAVQDKKPVPKPAANNLLNFFSKK